MLSDGAEVTISTPDGSLANVRALPAPVELPAGFEYPIDFIGFDIERLERGATVEVTLRLPDGLDADTYVKCNASACAVYPNATITGRDITLSLTDGGAGDSDGQANGFIRDPGTPALATDGSGRGNGGGALGGWLLTGLFLSALGRRRYALSQEK